MSGGGGGGEENGWVVMALIGFGGVEVTLKKMLILTKHRGEGAAQEGRWKEGREKDRTREQNEGPEVRGL